MLIIKTDIDKPKEQAINKTVNVLLNGGLVVYPTDTAYGLGGNALDEKVIKKIYEVKNRDFTKPTHVIVRDWKMIEKITYPNTYAKKLYDQLLPGPLTIILSKKNSVPNLLTSGLDTLGVRIPNCEVTKLISKNIDFPYTTTSANASGGKTPYSINDVLRGLDTEKIDLIIDAGKLPSIKPSTMIDLTNEPFKILREGPIKKSQLEKVLTVKIVL